MPTLLLKPVRFIQERDENSPPVPEPAHICSSSAANLGRTKAALCTSGV